MEVAFPGYPAEKKACEKTFLKVLQKKTKALGLRKGEPPSLSTPAVLKHTRNKMCKRQRYSRVEHVLRNVRLDNQHPGQKCMKVKMHTSTGAKTQNEKDPDVCK